MTEICETNTLRNRHLIDPVAFIAALVLAPLLVAALGFWLVIPVFAVLMGGLPYLLAGGPLLACGLRYNEPSFYVFAGIGLLANTATPFLVFLFYIAKETPEAALSLAAMSFGFGLIFAPLWCGVFAVLYRRLRRELYSRPL